MGAVYEISTSSYNIGHNYKRMINLKLGIQDVEIKPFLTTS